MCITEGMGIAPWGAIGQGGFKRKADFSKSTDGSGRSAGNMSEDQIKVGWASGFVVCRVIADLHILSSALMRIPHAVLTLTFRYRQPWKPLRTSLASKAWPLWPWHMSWPSTPMSTRSSAAGRSSKWDFFHRIRSCASSQEADRWFAYRRHLKQNVTALDIHLTLDQVKTIEAALPFDYGQPMSQVGFSASPSTLFSLSLREGASSFVRFLKP